MASSYRIRSFSPAAALLLLAALLCGGAHARKMLDGGVLSVVPLHRALLQDDGAFNGNDGCASIGINDFGTNRTFATCSGDGKLVSVSATVDANGNLLTVAMGCPGDDAPAPAEGLTFAACPENTTIVEVRR